MGTGSTTTDGNGLHPPGTTLPTGGPSSPRPPDDCPPTEADPATLPAPTEPGETLPGRDDRPAPRPEAPTGPRYRRVRLHARGGVGRVWLAEDGRLSREVALKELRPERSDHPQTVARFLAEARVTGRLVHPGIVAVHDLGEDERGTPYYTMPFVAGKTLERAIADYHRDAAKGVAGPVERDALLLALVAVCNAVAYAHSRGVIHRDLKGQNIIVGEFGETIVLDWGLAKALDPAEAARRPSDGPWLEPGQTLDGQAMGTPAWMAPEQAEGRLDLVGTRTDVYGLGAILFQVLTGRAPFDGEDSRTIIEKVRKGPPPTPREVVPSTPRALDAVCRTAMMRDPAARYASPLDLAADIRRWLADEPVSVMRERASARAGRWGRRHRHAASAIAAVLVLGLVGLAAGNVVFARLRQDALAAKARSDRHFDLAREAVDKMLVTVGEERLADVPQMEPVRRSLFGDALDLFEVLLRDGGDDRRVRLDAAQAYRMAANLERYAAHLDAARPLYRRSITLLEGLIAGRPRGSETPQFRLAETLVDAADAESLADRSAAAVALYRRARDLASPLAEAAPADARYRLLDGHSQVGLATLENEVGRFAEGLGAADRAIARIGPIAGGPGVAPVETSVLLIAESARAHALGRLGRAVEAEAAYKGLIRRARDHARAAPAEHDRPYMLALGLSLLGAHLAPDPARGIDALGAYDEAAALLRRVAADFPDTPMYRESLADALGGRGRLRAATRSPEAAGDLDESRRLLDQLLAQSPGSSEALGLLGRTLLGLGRLAESRGDPAQAKAHYRAAAETLAKAVAADPDKVEFREDLARARADAAR